MISVSENYFCRIRVDFCFYKIRFVPSYDKVFVSTLVILFYETQIALQLFYTLFVSDLFSLHVRKILMFLKLQNEQPLNKFKIWVSGYFYSNLLLTNSFALVIS
jgi:hypothetical protein